MVIFFWHVALSRETLSRSHLSAAHPLLCYSVGCLPSLVSTLHRPGPSVSSCSGTLHDLPLCSSNTFSGHLFFHFLRRFLPCILAMLAFALALRLHTDLHWHKIIVNALLCSRDLKLAIPMLFQLKQASTRSSSILSTFTSVMMSSITVSGYCVGTSSLRLQDNTFLGSPTNLGSHSLTNCLFPANPSFTTCTATPVQCLHHHEYVLHQHADLSDESRRRRLFCNRQFQLVPLVHGSEI